MNIIPRIITILLPIIVLQYACSIPLNDKEKLNCLDKYIYKVAQLDVYNEVRKGLTDSIASWKSKNLKLRCCSPDSTILDSAIFFNEDLTRCIFLVINSLDTNSYNTFNFVQTLGGEKINGNWHYYHVSFPTLTYELKSNGNKNFSPEYLSRDARLDIINRGFFTNGSCKINYSYIDSEEWFADWVREKHQYFLQGF